MSASSFELSERSSVNEHDGSTEPDEYLEILHPQGPLPPLEPLDEAVLANFKHPRPLKVVLNCDSTTADAGDAVHGHVEDAADGGDPLEVEVTSSSCNEFALKLFVGIGLLVIAISIGMVLSQNDGDDMSDPGTSARWGGGASLDWHCGLDASWGHNVSGDDECFRDDDCPDICDRNYPGLPACGCTGRCYNDTAQDWLPTATGSSCCCEVKIEIAIGRPFSVDGVARVARSESSATLRPWSQESCAINVSADFDPGLKTALGTAWARAGAAEHASVASFSRHSLQLLSLGAPPGLLERVHRASLDEVRHSRLCYSLASRYLGREVGPGRLDVRNSLGDLTSTAILGSVVAEGCVGETVAAVEARLASRLARDAEVAMVLATIALEEAQHAELGWAAIAWMMSPSGDGDAGAGPSAKALVPRAAVAASFTGLLAQVQHQHQRADPTRARMRGEGILTPVDHAAVRALVLQRVVAPALEALLAGRPVAISERIAALPLDLVLSQQRR